MQVELTVLVVTWNSASVLPALLSSLSAGLRGVGSRELVIVDNASTDRTAALAASLAPEATLVGTGSNAGYAAGINAGLAAARRPSDAVLVINPDVRLEPECAVRLLRGLRSHPDAGIAVPRIRHPDDTLARTLRREPSVLRALGEAVLGGRIAGRWTSLGEVVVAPEAYEAPAEVAWASGALMLVSRACLERTGPWDESFFLYSEETEFSLRARDAGFATWYVPDAVAIHLGGEAHRSPELWALLVVNRWRLFRRRHRRPAAAAYRCALGLGEALRAVAGRRTSRAALRALLSGRAPVAGR